MSIIKTLDSIQQLFQQHAKRIQMAKEQLLFREGEQAKAFYLVESGTLQICKVVENGKELTLSLAGPRTFVGESTFFQETLVHSTTAKALQPATLLTLPVAVLEAFLHKQPTTMIDYLKWVQNENIKNQSRIRDLLMHGKKGALYSTLIRLVNTYGKACEEGWIISLPLTNTDLANLCATSREVVNRLLNDLKKAHVITFEKGCITVLDVAYLKRSIACDQCTVDVCRID